MHRTLAALSAAVSLFAMSAVVAHAQAAPAAATAVAAPAIVDPDPMVFPGWGFNVADLDRTVKPGDDFNGFVNGKWVTDAVIPPQFPYYGTAVNLQLGAARDIRAIVDELSAANPAQGSLERRIADSYKAYLDTAAIDAAGLAPAQPHLSRIFAAKTHGEVASLFAAPGISAPFGQFVSIDRNDPTRNTLYLAAAGLGLPDRDNYLVDNPRNLEIRAKYKDYLAFLLGKAGYSDPAATAEVVYGLERQMAEIAWDRTVARNPLLTTNPASYAEIEAMAGGFAIKRYFDEAGIATSDTFNLIQVPPTAEEIKAIGLTPEQLAKLGGGLPAMFRLITDTPVANWQAWLAKEFLSGYADVLPSDIDDANFAFYGKFLQGREIQRERWRRGLGHVQGQMGEAIGKVYVERHFPAASKAAMEELVGNLRKAMAANLVDLAWMTPATRAAAQRKLDAFNVKIGYPAEFETYDGLTIKPGAPLENAIGAGDWAWKDQLGELREPVDKAKWLMTPQTVNAYYMATANEIVFPAAYLQPPYFNPAADPAVNYGAVGSTIGHEIGHGFDDNGSRYDGSGALKNWWTDEDKATFAKLGEKLAAQYDKACPFDEGKTCINGKLTLGENIGDLGGISMAYQAYKLSLNGKPAPVIDGLTGDQRFFIAYAQSFRSKWREAFQRQIMQTDSHSPDDARVNEVLRNFDPWYAAFNVRADDAMYLKPEDRVRIW